MKRFFKQIFTIALGTILGGVLTLLLMVGVIILIQKYKFSSDASSKIIPKTVLRIHLHGQLVEQTNRPFIDVLGTDRLHEVNLVALKKIIREARNDDRISGIYLEVSEFFSGWATLSELRSVLSSFKAAGKFVIAYSGHYTSKTYYLASLADEIILHPAGNFGFVGLSMTILFYKELLDKLEIIPQPFRVGKYKAAIEPFINSKMSEASKEQNYTLLNTIYDHLIDTLAVARNLTPNSLKEMAANLSVTQPEEALKAKLVTRLGYFSDAEALIRARLQLETTSKINYINWSRYKSKSLKIAKCRDKIAVLNVVGTIVNEESGRHYVDATTFQKTLKKLRKDTRVKAIVLRINSPGGSALASDSMWKELMLTREHKPIVASMSDLAASGGYYIATACNQIYANPTTITGSIGIFGLIFEIHALLKNTLGIYGDVVKTSPSADMFSPTRPLVEREKEIIQKHINDGYERFLNRIVEGRGMKKADVARLAEGRVWPGTLAKEHGLVDELGSLDDAIKKAASLAGIEQGPYYIVYSPRRKRNWAKDLIAGWYDIRDGNLIKNAFLKLEHIIATGKQLITNQQVQAWFPYTIEIE